VGGTLRATGVPSLAHDTLLLRGADMPDSFALYFQGTGTVNGTAGQAFGDGLRCVGGAVVRLGTRLNVGNQSQYPGAGGVAVSVRGAVTAPGQRFYQVWFRNAASFCTPSTFNLTNGLSVVWAP
jgi:hypothetical protein